MSTAVYLRVSTVDQRTESQEADLARYVADREMVSWYHDAFTGTTMQRPGWGRLLEDLRAGRVAELVVWRLDRLGRTAAGLTSLFDELRRRAVNLVSLRDGIDLSTPAGTLMANVLASVAQYETEVRRERSAAGMRAAQARGVHCGRPRGTAKPIKMTEAKRELALRLIREGWTKPAIAEATGLSERTIYRLLGPTPTP